MQNSQGPDQVAHVPGSVSPSADRSPEFQFKGWSLLFPADMDLAHRDTGAQERLLQRGQQLVRGPGPPSLLCANSLICIWLLLIFNQNKLVISFQSPGWRVKCGYSPNSHGWDSFHQAHARNLQAESKVCADRTREAAGSNHAPFGALHPGWDGCLLRQLLSPCGLDRSGVSNSIYNLCGGFCDLATRDV